MGFIRGYADLTGYRIGNFNVDALAGTDRKRAPLWQITCHACRVSQTFEHRTLCNALESGRPKEVLACKNARCANSRKKTIDETPSLFEIRQQERENRRRAAQQAAEAHAQSERDAATAKAREAALAPLRAEWAEYSRQQIKAGTLLHEIAPLKRWIELGDSLRSRIMVAIRKDPTIKVTSLRR
jgi:hypothetical protein